MLSLDRIVPVRNVHDVFSACFVKTGCMLIRNNLNFPYTQFVRWFS